MVRNRVSESKRDKFLNWARFYAFFERTETRKGGERRGEEMGGGGGVEWPARTAYD